MLQYSAAYSVPCRPLHSSVNSFTMSFTLRLFTRSLRICWEKLSFCSVVMRDDGKPGGCSASFNHTASREKQCLFRLNKTSANWSIRLRDAPPPMPSSTACTNSLPSSCTTLANGGTSEQCGRSSVKKRHVDLTVGASGNLSDRIPQWNTAFTSRLSDKNKSGFRLRALLEDGQCYRGNQLKQSLDWWEVVCLAGEDVHHLSC